jgi:hypothetical protein
MSATGRDQLPVIDGQPTAARFKSRSVLCMAVPLIEGISVSPLLTAAFAAKKIERGESTCGKLHVQLICGWDVGCVARDDVRRWI